MSSCLCLQCWHLDQGWIPLHEEQKKENVTSLNESPFEPSTRLPTVKRIYSKSRPSYEIRLILFYCTWRWSVTISDEHILACRPCTVLRVLLRSYLACFSLAHPSSLKDYPITNDFDLSYLWHYILKRKYW